MLVEDKNLRKHIQVVQSDLKKIGSGSTILQNKHLKLWLAPFYRCVHCALPTSEMPNYLYTVYCCFSMLLYALSHLGLATEFRSEKIPRNRLGMVSVIPRKKVLIPRHSETHGRVNSEARNGNMQEYLVYETPKIT